MIKDLPDWQQSPGQIGASLSTVDTPALIIDLDALEFNLANVHARVHAAGARIRAHAKAHKSVDIAKRQIAAGAIGICCQKASEAQVFVEAGIQDVMISNEIYGKSKADRVARLAKYAKISICVDALEQIDQLAQAAQTHQTNIDMFVEIDVGQGRCGVKTPEAALALARSIVSYTPHLRLVGIQAYGGSAQHFRSPADRQNAVFASAEKVKQTLKLLQSEGHEIRTVAGGGTGTYELESNSGVYNEVQPGSYVLMDGDYSANTLAENAPALQHALYGLCTVISVSDKQAVLDGGLKAFATDSGLPNMVLPGWSVKSISDEHMVIVHEPETEPLQIGDKVRLIPGHCDPTVNLHNWLIAIRGQIIDEVWPVSARGALF